MFEMIRDQLSGEDVIGPARSIFSSLASAGIESFNFFGAIGGIGSVGESVHELGFGVVVVPTELFEFGSELLGRLEVPAFGEAVQSDVLEDWVTGKAATEVVFPQTVEEFPVGNLDDLLAENDEFGDVDGALFGRFEQQKVLHGLARADAPLLALASAVGSQQLFEIGMAIVDKVLLPQALDPLFLFLLHLGIDCAASCDFFGRPSRADGQWQRRNRLFLDFFYFGSLFL